MSSQTEKLHQLAKDIKQWAATLGFAQAGIADLDLDQYLAGYRRSIEQGYFGDMDFMSRNQALREQPDLLQEGALRVISVRLNYLPKNTHIVDTLRNGHKAYISRYALGRDYHKLMRKKLKQLGDMITDKISDDFPTSFRPFVDSAPVLERPLAEKAGLGWIGKHSLLINPDEGSLFFLGEILINLALPVDKSIEKQCGKCSACMQMCPTNAIVAPYQVDARRCISYLTIETDAPIPVELRPLLGNRIYGCDDCQLACPWNRLAQTTQLDDFSPRQDLDSSSLLSLFSWTEQEFLTRTQGSAIRRIGFGRWQRNIAVALGNAPYSTDILEALTNTKACTDMVQEHMNWALNEQSNKRNLTLVEHRKKQRLLRISAVHFNKH